MKTVRSVLQYSRHDGAFLTGGIILIVAMVLAIIGPYITPYDPQTSSPDVYIPPSPEHLFGTDSVGADVFSRTIAAFRIDVFMAVAAVTASSVIGTLLGALAGFSFSSKPGQALSWVILRLADMAQSFPVFIMAFALVGTFGPSIRNVVIAIAFVSIPAFLRLSRGAVLTAEKEAYVDAARVMSLRELRILIRHVLPNSLEPVIANLSVSLSQAILMTAGLSFLGAGVRPPTPEWGLIISAGSSGLVTGAWWITVLPGLVMAATIVGFALLGDGVRRYLNPSDRQRRMLASAGRGAA
nr:ABC transporter permease [Propionicimonas sp.]